MSKKWILSLALAVSVSVMVACGGEDATEDENNQQEESNGENNEENSSEDGGSEGEASQETETPDPDLSDIPEVVAEVNGEEIAKSEFESVYVQTLNTYASQGMNIEEQDKNGEMQKQLQKQTVNQLVGQELLIQEANNQNISASEDEINKELTSLKEQFGSDEQFQKALDSEEISEDELKGDIEQQVKVNKLVENETGEIEVTDQEVEEMYNQMVDAQSGENSSEGESSEEGDSEGESSEDGESAEQKTPSLEKMRPQIEQQITKQKESKQMQSLVDELRESGDVTVNI